MVKQMTNREAIEMMQHCMHEIRDLQAQVERLQPKASAYDNLVKILKLLPEESRGYTKNLSYILERRIGELQSIEANEKIETDDVT